MLLNAIFASSILIPLYVYIRRLWQSFVDMPFLGLFLMSCFTCDALSFLRIFWSQKNIDVITAYFVLQTMLVPVIFLRRQWKSQSYVWIICTILIVAGAMSILAVYYWLIDHQMPTWYFALSSITILILSGTFFVHEIQFNFHRELWSSPFFYIAVAFYLYHSVVTTIYISMLEITEPEFFKVWNIKLVAYLIHNIFIAVGIYQIPRES